MVPRKIENRNKTITINCAGTCQRVAVASGGVLAGIVVVPILFGLVLLYARAVYSFFYWLLDIQDCGPYGVCAHGDPVVAGIFTVFAVIALIGVGIASVVYVCTHEMIR